MHPDSFPADLLLNEPERGRRLLAEFYQQYHSNDDPDNYVGPLTGSIAAWFKGQLESLGHGSADLGLDVGVRFGGLPRMVGLIDWVGVDVDATAVEHARANGVRAEVMDFTFDIGFKDASFDAVMMTEVLEHLPYPSIIVREVHRILRRDKKSAYLGTVPLDYHLHRRWKVLRGRRLSGEQTHVHHFSFAELDKLLRFYFEEVVYKPLAGTACRYPKLGLPYNLFVRDIAWVAYGPRASVPRWELGKV